MTERGRNPLSSTKTPIAISIDGEIGAGKTTLLELLVRGFKDLGLTAVIVSEPVNVWKDIGILQAFYDPNHSLEVQGMVAYIFQTFTFVTRVDETINVVEANPDADVFILERSVLTDRFIFMELQRVISGPMLMAMYEYWWRMWNRIMPLQPSKFIYLKPTLENCQARVAKRAREGEVNDQEADEVDTKASARGGVSAAYQARLRRVHEAYLQGMHTDEFAELPPRPFDPARDVTVVEGPLADDDFSRPGPAADQIIKHIIEKVLQ